VLVLISANAVSGYLPSARHYRPESESEASRTPFGANCEVAGGCGINLSFVRVADDPPKGNTAAPTGTSTGKTGTLASLRNEIIQRIARNPGCVRLPIRFLGRRSDGIGFPYRSFRCYRILRS